jgi:propionaldehyde dehydrogenase
MNTNELETMIRTILSEKMANTATVASGKSSALFTDVDGAIQAAHRAYREYMQCSLQTRRDIISKIRAELEPLIPEMAERAAQETGMGNAADKILKNRAALLNTPGVEDLTTVALTGDNGMALFELSPFGVIGAIAPSTNPTETIINNSISMLAAGNAVYFSPHPGAKAVSLCLIEKIEQIIFDVCGIRHLVVSVAEPTFAATQEMMSHPKIAVLTVTGGPAIVDMAMRSGKKVIGAGAGNPPCIVDETACLRKAAKDIISGASFDYNLPCISEKSVIVVDCVADELIGNMVNGGALLVKSPADIVKLRNAVINEKGDANKKLVGKSPITIAKAAGLSCNVEPKIIIVEVERDDLLVTVEQLMPVLPIVRVRDFEEALQVALDVEQGLHHTATMHSENVSRLNKAAKMMQTSIFVKNGPSYAGISVGGEGFTTFTIATPTGEGTTSARTFARSRRCVLTNGFSIR